MQLLAMTGEASDRLTRSSKALALSVVAEWGDAQVIPAGCELWFEVENLVVGEAQRVRIARLECYGHFEKRAQAAEKLKIL